jgi:hypothetical protein
MIMAPSPPNRLVFTVVLALLAWACGPATPNPDDPQQGQPSGISSGEGGGAGTDPALNADLITPADHDIEVPPAP